MPILTDPGGIIPAGTGAGGVQPDAGLEGGEVGEDVAAEELFIWEMTWTRGIALLFFLVAVNFMFAVARKEYY